MLSQKVLNKLQAFHFRSTVYTNTTPTVIINSYVFQKPPFFDDDCVPNGSTDKVAAWGVLIYS